jgi:hypothetical protein
MKRLQVLVKLVGIVGIGTTNPQYALDVNGAARLGSPSGMVDSGAGDRLKIWTSATEFVLLGNKCAKKNCAPEEW